MADNIDTSKIKNLEERQQIAGAYDAKVAAQKELADARAAIEAKHKPESDRIGAMWDDYSAQHDALERTKEKELLETGAEERLSQAIQALKPLGNFQRTYDVDTGYYTKPKRCALSGLVILEGDDVLEGEGDEYVLRDLVLPERPAEEDDDDGEGDDENDAADAEVAA